MPTRVSMNLRDFAQHRPWPTAALGLVLVAFVAVVLVTQVQRVAAAPNTWSPAGNMADERVLHTATLLPNGKVLAVGGTGGAGNLASADLYDPLTNTWSASSSMASERSYPTATLLPNGKVLAAGGGSNTDVVASAELYDPATNTWSPAASMATARSGHLGTLLLNGKVLVVGGFGDIASGGAYLASAELYDPITDAWSTAGSMAVGRYQHTATLLPNGKVLVAGGYDTSAGFWDSAELYDPATNTWSAAASMGEVHYSHTATLLPNGKVLVVGGFNGAFAGAEIYDPAANTWSVAASMVVSRYLHTATLLQNGQVLVVGGSSAAGDQATAELYDPVTNAWSATGSMAVSRSSHTATLLLNGNVLAAGGQGGPTGYLASAELYEPPTAGGTPQCGTFQGFSPPVDNLPALNSGKAGRTYPLKWRCIAPDGSYVRDLAVVEAIGSQEVSCSAIEYVASDALEVSTSGNSVLRYDTSGEQFIFNWQTPKSKTTKCYVFVLVLSDGSWHVANFMLKP